MKTKSAPLQQINLI